ncbi:hypothetical protein [Flavobacterium sp. FlaQc-48]|uniref:hypothetical protein n=1 Tax=Flavobacterium sp. FlaQc-48 TaxID=3374181 RepID=UPI0037580820
MEEKRFFIKRGYFDNAIRELVFSHNFLKFEDKDLSHELNTIFQKEEIKDFRYGIRWIKFEITYGREYQIFIRNKQDKTLKITFKSYFGHKKEILHKQYSQIVDNLWDYYFADIINDFINIYNDGREFTIGDVHFSKEGISLNVSGIFNEKRIYILWENVRTKNYHTYFSIYSAENPQNINRGYNYHQDWNVSVLYSVIRTILRNKGIENYN